VCIVTESFPAASGLDLLVAATSQRQHQMKYDTPFNSIVRSSLVINHLLSAKDYSLLYGWNAFLLFDPLLDTRHLVGGFNVQLHLFASQRLDFDLHDGNSIIEEWYSKSTVLRMISDSLSPNNHEKCRQITHKIAYKVPPKLCTKFPPNCTQN